MTRLPVAALVITLFAAVAVAKDNASPPLSKDHCAKLDSLWTALEDELQQLGPCPKGPKQAVCLAIRHDMFEAQIEIEQIMSEGQCSRFGF